jgi:hypothetical protein
MASDFFGTAAHCPLLFFKLAKFPAYTTVSRHHGGLCLPNDPEALGLLRL